MMTRLSLYYLKNTINQKLLLIRSKLLLSNIHASSNARNLGIVFDKTLSMEAHIKNMCKSTYFQIRNINLIRKVLDDDTATTLVHALVTSRHVLIMETLYYMELSNTNLINCNVRLHGLENLITIHLFYNVSIG